MGRGRLRCIGTSLHLKSRFGSGYRVSVRVEGARSAATVFAEDIADTPQHQKAGSEGRPHKAGQPVAPAAQGDHLASAQMLHLKEIFMKRLGVKSGKNQRTLLKSSSMLLDRKVTVLPRLQWTNPWTTCTFWCRTNTKIGCPCSSLTSKGMRASWESWTCNSDSHR